MRKNKMTCGIPSLADDILVDILTRLPAKVVGQCKCICKHWRSLIDNPSFRDLHRVRAKSRQGGCYLFISIISFDDSKIHLFSANYEGGPAQHLLSYLSRGWCHVKQSVEGLICGLLGVPQTVFILNPTTQEFVTLPPSGFVFDNGTPDFRMPLLSFGFDPSTKQYKVLIISSHRNPTEKDCYDYECEIFTLGTHAWRKLDDVPVHFEFGGGSRCVNGVIFWRNTSYLTEALPSRNEDVIVAFDLKDERFRVIPLPSGPSCMSRLLELGGHLVLAPAYPHNNLEELWVLQDYENWIWIKERVMPPLDWVLEDDPFTVGEIQTGEILLQPSPTTATHLMSIYYFDRKRKSFRKVKITGLPESELWFRCLYGYLKVTDCVENLFSLRDI